MDLKQLRYFTTVAEEGTISAAAKKLFMSQPPLSTQMKLLEQELGCSLFERGQKHIRLTETGRLLYDRAQTLLRMEASMRQDVEACARTEKDTIRIGVVSSVICTRAGEWISDFLKKNDGVTIEITESNTYSLIEKLRTDQIHAERAVGISLVPGSAAGLLHSEKAEFHSIADCPIETEIVLIYKENAYFPESVKKFTDYLMTIK